MVLYIPTKSRATVLIIIMHNSDTFDNKTKANKYEHRWSRCL